jgi:cytochrome c oxidase subunit II
MRPTRKRQAPFFAGEAMKLFQAACAAIAFVVVGSGPLPFVGAPTAPLRIDVTAKRFAFDPASITVKKGEPVDLVLKSLDVPHGLRFRELNVEVKAGKGKTGEVQFTPEKVGDFVGHCSVFCGAGHGSMQLTLHVVE